MKESGDFELVAGHDIMQSYPRWGQREIPSKIVSITDEEADRTFQNSRRLPGGSANVAEHTNLSEIGV
jgi:hypothetical protein